MKTFLNILFLIIFVSWGKNFTFAQSSTTMQDIIETVTAKIVELEDEKSQEVVNITMDLLVRDGKKTLYRFLDPSFDYTMIAIGDRRISKLKVTVYKKTADNWEYVAEVSDAKPEIKIFPANFEQYEFTIAVDEFKGNNTTGHYAILLYHRNPEK
ncbi:MAG: hypothetical protein ACRDFC_10135 [Ignavibacteria bacterium]